MENKSILSRWSLAALSTAERRNVVPSTQTVAFGINGAHAPRVGPPRRVAIVHDWLPVYGGAERVLEQIIEIFPDAELFAMIDTIPEDQRGFLKGKPVCASFIQWLPFAKKHYRSFLPIMPLAVEQFNMRPYDLIISNSYAVAKGVLTGPDQLHICYCCSPIRYAWDLQPQYLEETNLTSGVKGWFAKALLHYVRLWDTRTSSGVDEFVTLSKYVKRRIQKVYRRDATVIYPPVDVEKFTAGGIKENFYLTASRIVPYKRIDLIVEAFAQMPDRKLVVIGDGPSFAKVAAKASPNVQMLGFQDNAVLKDYMQRARAFIFAAEEDFGIIPLEAQACGMPVIAFGKGGARETVVPGVTGVFFDQQTTESLCVAVNRFERLAAGFDPAIIRQHAEKFSAPRFRKEFSAFVTERWEKFQVSLEV